MAPEDFRALVAGINELTLCEFLKVQPVTLRRWKTGRAACPHATVELLRLKLNGDLAALGGPDWEGFRLAHDGKFYNPFFARGFDPHQLRAHFFTVQLARYHEHEARRLRAELDAVRAKMAEMESREKTLRALARCVP